MVSRISPPPPHTHTHANHACHVGLWPRVEHAHGCPSPPPWQVRERDQAHYSAAAVAARAGGAPPGQGVPHREPHAPHNAVDEHGVVLCAGRDGRRQGVRGPADLVHGGQGRGQRPQAQVHPEDPQRVVGLARGGRGAGRVPPRHHGQGVRGGAAQHAAPCPLAPPPSRFHGVRTHAGSPIRPGRRAAIWARTRTQEVGLMVVLVAMVGRYLDQFHYRGPNYYEVCSTPIFSRMAGRSPLRVRAQHAPRAHVGRACGEALSPPRGTTLSRHLHLGVGWYRWTLTWGPRVLQEASWASSSHSRKNSSSTRPF